MHKHFRHMFPKAATGMEKKNQPGREVLKVRHSDPSSQRLNSRGTELELGKGTRKPRVTVKAGPTAVGWNEGCPESWEEEGPLFGKLDFSTVACGVWHQGEVSWFQV